MNSLKVVKVNPESLEFENGVQLYSNHDTDCCENHYLSFHDLSISDFEGLEFNIATDDFFRKINGYGIELIPLQGHSVKIPGYGSNNGYYSSDLTLVITDEKGFKKQYDITECQEIND